jgi:hypothetical protein
MIRTLLILTLIMGTQNLWAHARLLPGGNTPPRSNDTGLKSGPCGNIVKGTPVASFNSGQTIILQWEETINHPGYFEFSLSNDDDQTFDLLLTVPDEQNSRNDLPHRYQAELKLPDGLTCSNCTLQMVQQMTENPANPRPYFSCSDIEIKNSGQDTPMNPIDEDKNTAPPVPEDCH